MGDLYHAARQGDLESVKYWIEIGGIDKDIANVCNLRTPLHAASNEGHLDVVQILVEQGADQNKTTINGETPIAMASFNGHLEVVKYLLEQGSSIEKVDNDGWTPLNSGVLAGQLEVVQYLLEQGADRDKGNVEGGTPLHHAAHMGDLDILLLLMSYGANLNARSSDGQLPIDLALKEEIKQAIRNEPRRRLDHGLKRTTEPDRDCCTVTSQAATDTQHNDKVANQGNDDCAVDEDERLAILFERLTYGKKQPVRKPSNVETEEEDSDDSGTSDEEEDT